MLMALSGCFRSPNFSTTSGAMIHRPCRARQHIDQPDVGLFEQKLDGIAVHDLHSVHGVQQNAAGSPSPSGSGHR